MTSPRRFEQDLPALLADLYVAGIPDYRDDLVQRVAVTHQRAAWTLPERWLPMDIATTRVPVARMPWRPLGVLALMVILIAGALALYVGSRPDPLPAPFGPAANGLVVYSADGDVFTADPTAGLISPVVTGPQADVDPRFSRDGTNIVFARRAVGLFASLLTVRPDGTGLTEIADRIALTPSRQGEPWRQYEFSPDGRSILIASTADEIPGISIAQTDGSGIKTLDVGRTAYEPSFRPPDGREVLFVGYPYNGNGGAGIYAVDVASGAVRSIVETAPDYDLAGATWSPDGSKIAYWKWGGGNTGINAKTHVVGADGTGDRELPVPDAAVWNAGADWSNDGTRLVVVRGYTDDYQDVRAAIAPADGSTTGVEIDIEGVINEECCSTWEWAPDDRKILLTPMGVGGVLPQVVIDVATGVSSPATWDTKSDPSWQRRAR